MATNAKALQAIPVIADRVTVELDRVSCLTVGATLKMLARQAPQPEVAETLKRVGEAMQKAAMR